MCEPDLVLAMPVEPLAGARGFIPAGDLAPLAALADASWYATEESIADDPLGRPVQLGVVVARPGGNGRELLAGGDGLVLHRQPVPAGAVDGGGVLGSLRRLALAAARARLGAAGDVRCTAELAGWIHDPRTPGLERVLVLVYRVVTGPGQPAPAGGAWAGRSGLAGLPLAPACRLALAAG